MNKKIISFGAIGVLLLSLFTSFVMFPKKTLAVSGNCTVLNTSPTSYNSTLNSEVNGICVPFSSSGYETPGLFSVEVPGGYTSAYCLSPNQLIDWQHEYYGFSSVSGYTPISGGPNLPNLEQAAAIMNKYGTYSDIQTFVWPDGSTHPNYTAVAVQIAIWDVVNGISYSTGYNYGSSLFLPGNGVFGSGGQSVPLTPTNTYPDMPGMSTEPAFQGSINITTFENQVNAMITYGQQNPLSSGYEVAASDGTGNPNTYQYILIPGNYSTPNVTISKTITIGSNTVNPNTGPAPSGSSTSSPNNSPVQLSEGWGVSFTFNITNTTQEFLPNPVLVDNTTSIGSYYVNPGIFGWSGNQTVSGFTSFLGPSGLSYSIASPSLGATVTSNSSYVGDIGCDQGYISNGTTTSSNIVCVQVTGSQNTGSAIVVYKEVSINGGPWLQAGGAQGETNTYNVEPGYNVSFQFQMVNNTGSTISATICDQNWNAQIFSNWPGSSPNQCSSSTPGFAVTVGANSSSSWQGLWNLTVNSNIEAYIIGQTMYDLGQVCYNGTCYDSGNLGLYVVNPLSIYTAVLNNSWQLDTSGQTLSTTVYPGESVAFGFEIQNNDAYTVTNIPTQLICFMYNSSVSTIFQTSSYSSPNPFCYTGAQGGGTVSSLAGNSNSGLIGDLWTINIIDNTSVLNQTECVYRNINNVTNAPSSICLNVQPASFSLTASMSDSGDNQNSSNSPIPVFPGDTVNIGVSVTNNGQTSTSTTINNIPGCSSGITVCSSETSGWNVGQVNSGQTVNETLSITVPNNVGGEICNQFSVTSNAETTTPTSNTICMVIFSPPSYSPSVNTLNLSTLPSNGTYYTFLPIIVYITNPFGVPSSSTTSYYGVSVTYTDASTTTYTYTFEYYYMNNYYSQTQTSSSPGVNTAPTDNWDGSWSFPSGSVYFMPKVTSSSVSISASLIVGGYQTATTSTGLLLKTSPTTYASNSSNVINGTIQQITSIPSS